MFENVLVGIDGKDGGRDAIALARRLAGERGRLTLGHVHPGELNPLHAASPAVLREEREASHELLERERQAAQVDAELVCIVAGTPGRGLHDRAEEQRADLIVVGSCSRGIFGRAMLGDDTRGALNGAPCAVGVAARGYAVESAPLREIGVGYDGSQESGAALDAARAVAERAGAKLHAMEVVSLPTYAYTGIIPPLTGDALESMLAEARGRLQGLAGVDGVAVYGLVGEELAAFGDRLDLLVVGSRSYGPWRRLVLGSTSNYLERHARCSLLVLPRGGAADGQA